MADLIGFLTDRLDEDEAAAQLAVRAIPDKHGWYHPMQQLIAHDEPERGIVYQHVVRHSPARVLAEVQAKRHIIDEHPAVTERTSWDEERTICDRCRYDDGLDTYTFPCPTLCLLALPYDTHEDYDEAWRP